ncbi:MAG: IclR family transcriptional regulator [Anaerolineales bacterium]|nr:IclR family transcriptional regulator [Anaerolineales bacterium]
MATSSNGVSVREAARALGYSPSVVQKSMQALVSQDFAIQDSVTQHYSLGPAALQVGLSGLAKLELRKVAHSHLEQLTEATGETALLGIRHGDHAIYIDKVVSPNDVRLDPPLGAARPFNCTAIGKALLAYLSDGELERLGKSGAFATAEVNSIIDPTMLKLEMARVRERGVAIDREEYAPGAMCIAAPVRNHDGVVVASVSVSGPAPRMQAAENAHIEQVIAAAKAISAALGYRG